MCSLCCEKGILRELSCSLRFFYFGPVVTDCGFVALDAKWLKGDWAFASIERREWFSDFAFEALFLKKKNVVLHKILPVLFKFFE